MPPDDIKRSRRVFTRRGIVRPPYNPALEKYYRNRRMLFSKYAEGCALDAEGWYSATPEVVARATARRLMARGLMIDAFVGTGGNAIQQALYDTGGTVLAIDIDPAKIAMARHNASIYGVERRIEFVVGDFFALAPRLRAHAVFLSPPWGGVDYDESVRKAGRTQAAFHLTEMAIPSTDGSVNGMSLFERAATIAPTLGLFLPVASADDDLARLADLHPSKRCERVNLIWGGGKKLRPRALLACFHAGRQPSPTPEVLLSEVRCNTAGDTLPAFASVDSNAMVRSLVEHVHEPA